MEHADIKMFSVDKPRQVSKMVVNKGYLFTENEKKQELTVKIQDKKTIMHSLEESIDIAGSGWYGIGLLLVLSLATMAMGMDLFGFSVVVAGASCDLELDVYQTGVLLAMPFIGPIITSYPWGYISDVYGRKKSLLIALWCSFIASTISAFCPGWTSLAVLRFISTSFSCCAQSATYTLLGESTPRRVRDGYMLVMTSVLDFMLAVYTVIAYNILNLQFSVNLVLIIFPPWRLLSLILTLFLGAAALGTHFFHESPKFLLNAGREDETLEVLKRIWVRNGGLKENYPVNKVYLNEEGNRTFENLPLLKSLWEQVLPLFKPPLLWRSLQLYFLIAIVYGTSNPLYIWFPMLAQKFFEGINSQTKDQQEGMCNLIVSSYKNDTANGLCSSTMNANVMWSTVVQGLLFVFILFGLAKIAHRKRTITLVILTISGVSGVGAMLVPHNMTSFLLFFGLLASELTVGVIYSYFVELYPTSHRGMATCLCTMVTRVSSLAGIYLFGAFVMTHCSYTFYVCSFLMTCGILVSLWLPSDKQSKNLS